MSDNRVVEFFVRDDGIVVFKFHALHRQAAKDFQNIVSRASKNVPPKLRVLYDFTAAPPPTRYFLEVQGRLYNEFPHPDDEKSAYVTGPTNNSVWVHILRSYLTPKDSMRIFVKMEDALSWLTD